MKLNTAALSTVALRPVLADQTVFAVLKKAELKPTQSGGQGLNVECRVLNPRIVLNDGKEIDNFGVSLFRFISLTPTEKYNPDKTIKELAIAVGIETDDIEVEQLNQPGLFLKLRVKYKAAGTDKKSGKSFPEGNEIAGFLPIKPEDNFTPPAS